MPAWAAFLGIVASITIAVLARTAAKKANRTGSGMFGLANRAEDGWFFDRWHDHLQAAVLFFGVVALLFAAYFLEAVGAFN